MGGTSVCCHAHPFGLLDLRFTDASGAVWKSLRFAVKLATAFLANVNHSLEL